MICAQSTALEPKTKRDHCLKELIDTEKNYVDALQMIVQVSDCLYLRNIQLFRM